MKKLLILGACALLALSLLAMGCGGGKTAQKELLVGTEPAFAPFEFQEENSKEFVGFDMDLIKAIAKEMGYEKAAISGMGFDALIPALEAKTIDVAIAGMTITQERAQKVNFSDSYYKSGLAIVVRKDEQNIKSLEDLKGKRIAVQLGTTGAMEADKIEGAKVTYFNINGEACLELKNGAADAVIGDLPVEQYFLKQGGSDYAKLLEQKITSEDYGIATAKNNPELAKKVNEALAKLKQNGEYDKIYKKWFGEAAK